MLVKESGKASGLGSEVVLILKAAVEDFIPTKLTKWKRYIEAVEGPVRYREWGPILQIDVEPVEFRRKAAIIQVSID